MKQLFIFLIISFLFYSCDEGVGFPLIPDENNPSIELIATPPPFDLGENDATFYSDVPYGYLNKTVFDIFIPNSETPSGLLFNIHGGGFVTGNKIQEYSSNDFIDLTNNLLANNIAVANINYSLVGPNDESGISKCLLDVKSALQFIRFHANDLNIDKTKVVARGVSAGGAASLWLAFMSDMAHAENDHIIFRESTRIKGAVAIYTQASYDVTNWHNDIFSDFIPDGFSYENSKTILGEPRILSYFGVENETELFSSETQPYRNAANMLQWMTSDDPEFYASTIFIPGDIPTNANTLYHHPFHVKALYQKAILNNIPNVSYAPAIGIDNRDNEESIEAFILRKLSE